MNERDMSLLKAVGEAVKEQLAVVQQKYESALSAQSQEIENLTEKVKMLSAASPDEAAIARAVLAQIAVPVAPELPDIQQLVKDAVSTIQLPEAPKAPELPDIEGMINKAVEGIQIPPPALPNIEQLVKDAVSAISLPKDGDPGKDALQIEILPCIDQENSYPRGSYAIHKGGLWRSFQKTTGMKGWECLVDGISTIDITQNHEREFTVTAQLSSGVSTDKSFSIPVMIYRDIFKEGEEYSPGDSVTWAGSVWYCHVATGDKPGEPSSKGWKLAVKRGRDARPKA